MILNNPIVNGVLRFIITGLANDKKAAASIVDYSGRTVALTTASTLMNNTIKIGNLSSGIYKLVVRVDGSVLEQSFIK